ncbi:hypothetical protein TL16_g08332 [Triparma laevis f. inornata]|uniref:Uncharacterized protein n=1 Tax=Triparma laevis f. inornata TaxID=1714386 RepID=A0A9W7AXW1_9STRA|nr:hypothetical protein TL16_g08332 [Triparma laevis f. inornata]
MASLIYGSKRDLFTVNVCEATPPSTKYNIPSTFEKVNVLGKDSKVFGTTTRDEYGSYLALNNVSHLDPTSSSYTITHDNKGIKTFEPILHLSKTDPASDKKIYGISKLAKLTNMSKTERWEKEKKVKDKIGPGLYFKDRGVPMPSKPRALSYTFQKKVREGLGKGHLKVPGPGEYSPQINSKGTKAIGLNRIPASLGIEEFLKNKKGYRPRGFGVVPRFDERKEKRITISDSYMKKLHKAEEKAARADLAEKIRTTSTSHGTFGTSPQFSLFDTKSLGPGPGAYSPKKPPIKVSGNIKLGHKMPVPGGRGVEGEAVGDDDSFQTQGELIGMALIEDTGDYGVDFKMKVYRKCIDEAVKKGEIETKFDINEEVDDDDASCASAFKSMNDKLFFGRTPDFNQFVSHIPMAMGDLNKKKKKKSKKRNSKKD